MPSSVRSARPSSRPAAAPEIDRFRAQHLALARADVAAEHGRTQVTINEQESPLAWLARRKGRDGRALIEPDQLQAGERLRADFTSRASDAAHRRIGERHADRRRAGAANASDSMVAARQRVHLALDAVGPEMSGLLMDVCCFLKRLEDVERERVWPARSAKIVLQLGLERLARHYGYAAQARGGHARRCGRGSMMVRRFGTSELLICSRMEQSEMRVSVCTGSMPLRVSLRSPGYTLLHYATCRAASASRRMRSTIERKPFERCGVRCSRRPELLEQRHARRSQRSRARLAGIEREQDRDQPAHDMGVAVAVESQHRPAGAVRLHMRERARPGWRSPAPCWRRCGRLGKGGSVRPSSITIAVAVVPLVQQREILDDLVDRRHAIGYIGRSAATGQTRPCANSCLAWPGSSRRCRGARLRSALGANSGRARVLALRGQRNRLMVGWRIAGVSVPCGGVGSRPSRTASSRAGFSASWSLRNS